MADVKDVTGSCIVYGRDLVEATEGAAMCLSQMDATIQKSKNTIEDIGYKVQQLRSEFDDLKEFTINSLQTLNKNQIQFQQTMESLIVAVKNRNFDNLTSVEKQRKKQAESIDTLDVKKHKETVKEGNRTETQK